MENTMVVSYKNDNSSLDLDANFNIENFRLVSLASWTKNHVSRHKLARYGFYYVMEHDHVKCQFCEVVIGDWGIGDDPLTEHYKHSPSCPLINGEATNNIPMGPIEEFQEELLLTLNKNKSIVKYTPRANLESDNEIFIPRHPDYSELQQRLTSFQNWPKSLKQTPEDLSEAGFFYLGVGDEVKCFHCAGCLKDWEPNDSGLEEHKTHFEHKCGYIQTHYHELKKKISGKTPPKELVKATPLQISSLIHYMNQNTDLRDGKVNSANNKERYMEMWEQLVKELNHLDGPKKQIKAWREVWRNHKYNKKRKPNSPHPQTIQTLEIKNSEQEITNGQTIQYMEMASVHGQIKNIPKKRKYNESTVDQLSQIINFIEQNPQIKFELLQQQPSSSEWINFVNHVNLGLEQKSPEDWANVWRNKYLETVKNNFAEPSQNASDVQYINHILPYDEPSKYNEIVPTAKVLPKKRKLEEYTNEETEMVTQYKMDSDIMEMKYKNLEFEKMQLELENQRKQLEIEKLKMKLEFAETKRDLEIQKDQLEKEKNRLAMERTSILIPI